MRTYLVKAACLLLISLGAWAGAGDGPAAMAPAFAAKASDPTFKRVDDRRFLRRVWLDLAGRLPDPQTTVAFLADASEGKYAAAIDQALASEAFTDRWTTFFADLFQNFALLEDSGLYRNAFHQRLRQMVAANTPWDEMARAVLTGSGKGESPQTAMFFWLKEVFEETYRLDYLDDQAGWITDAMLGVQTNCISCHNGQYHLEQVNVGLSKMKRDQFWGLAAFLSSTHFYISYSSFENEPENEAAEEDYFFRVLEVTDIDHPRFDASAGEVIDVFDESDNPNGSAAPEGEYLAESRPGQGMRPPRKGGVVKPAYPFTGETPKPGETRREALARILTADRQFARNMVNRVWAQLLGEGFVEPLNGWDLARLDETTAAANQSTVQPRNGFLLEFLTDWFIQNGYDLRGLIRLIANSKVYQWDYQSVEPGQGAIDANDRWGYWRDNKRVRRIEAEAVVDSMLQVLGITPKYLVTGDDRRLYDSAWQLPGPSEPNVIALFKSDGQGDFQLRTDLDEKFGVADVEELFFFLEFAQGVQQSFGRGDYLNGVPRTNDNDIQNSLLLMNGFITNLWMEESRYFPNVANLIEALGQGQIDGEGVARKLFRDALFREPAAGELSAIMAHIQGLEPGRAVTDTLWVVFNHPDFLHR